MTGLVYLAGPIAGQTYQQANEWRERAADLLSPLRAINPMRCKEFLNTGKVLEKDGSWTWKLPRHPLNVCKGIVTRDRNDLQRSDVVLMNLLPAQDTWTVSIGTMVELGWADAFRKPVVVVWNRAHNPHDHAFLREIAAYHAENLEDGIDLCKMIIL